MSVPSALLPISLTVPSEQTCLSPQPSSPYPSGSPERSPHNRAPTKKDAPFPEPSNCLLQFPDNGLPRFPNGSLRRETSISRAFFYTFPSKSPVNEPTPPPCSPTGSLWKEKPHLHSQWFICSFIYICQSPQ